MARVTIGTRLRRAAAAVIALALAVGAGCASTEFFEEGPGQPSDRASGAVPAGSLGVCKIPLSKRPPIVNVELWEHARPCTPRTPASFIRLGFAEGQRAPGPEQGDEIARILDALREGQKAEGGNAKMVALMRKLRERAVSDPEMRDRVARATARTSTCDYTYLLNTMDRERAALQPGNGCAAEAYDTKVRAEACLFDTSVREGAWVSSAWSCVAHTSAVGQAESCHRLCGYDDYCAMQVSCAASDVDLLLCVLGICLPEQRAGF